MLGVAFKPNSDDIRDSPSLDISGRLADEGAIVAVHDPVAMPNAARVRPGSPLRGLGPRRGRRDADLVLHLTEWTDYRAIDPQALRSIVAHPVLIDGRCTLDASQWRAASARCTSQGSPGSSGPKALKTPGR